ncbi:lysozyme, putative [Entamoeba invadens IP1]|uniref:Lysozyme, putative n=1 Tax=Entamoeba invadens IP1 TaxID=370355 RepID=L7FKH9_ENTIV|nr:lysozyme, putative [Entamoeba invadens IP1]ELP86675.1 lysozyme, putative [Entamoeba invadens IP1]|eukprot:XP_004186021.1 lysozyme, putative [Entamoeba invadens IP1]
MLLLFLSTLVSAGYYGVDYSDAVSVSSLSCFKSSGFGDMVIIRGWEEIYNVFDANAVQNLKNAYTAGYTQSQIDMYFEPCFGCGNLDVQLNDFWNLVKSNNMKFNKLWISLEVFVTHSLKTDVEELTSLLDKANALGINYGLLTSYSDIASFYGFTLKNPESVQLWWYNIDNQPNYDEYDKDKIHYIGWHPEKPAMKLYSKNMKLCNVVVNYDYKE